MYKFIIRLVIAAIVFTNSFSYAAEVKSTTQEPSKETDLRATDYAIIYDLYPTTEKMFEFLKDIQSISLKELNDGTSYLVSKGYNLAENTKFPHINGNEISEGKNKIVLLDKNSFKTQTGKVVKIKEQYESFDQQIKRLHEELNKGSYVKDFNPFINRAHASTLLPAIGILGLLGLMTSNAVSNYIQTVVHCAKTKILISPDEAKKLDEYINFKSIDLASKLNVVCSKNNKGESFFDIKADISDVEKKLLYERFDRYSKCSYALKESILSRKKNIEPLFKTGSSDYAETQDYVYQVAFKGKKTQCTAENAKNVTAVLRSRVISDHLAITNMFLKLYRENLPTDTNRYAPDSAPRPEHQNFYNTK